MPRQKKKAAADKVRSALSNESYGWCRTLRHSWDLAGPLTVESNGRELHYALVCVRCGTMRIDVMGFKGTIAGQFLGRYYKHPKGYLLTGLGDKRPKAATLRQQFFVGLLDQSPTGKIAINS